MMPTVATDASDALCPRLVLTKASECENGIEQVQSDYLPRPRRLAPSILAHARGELTSYDRTLRTEDIASLTAIAETVEAMAHGTAAPCLYLATQPTGWGKTAAVVAAVKAIVSNSAYAGVGVLVLVNQLEQIPTLIRRMGLREDQYAVRTGKDNEELNNMGLTGLGATETERKGAHHNAQVLFTTQQKLRALMAYQKDFRSLKFFEYRGRLRQVRLWDEAYIPIDPITITHGEIARFAERLAWLKQTDAASELRDWLDHIEETQPAYVVFPQWAFGLKLNEGEDIDDLLNALSESEEEQKATANAMFWLPGREVKIEREDYKQQTVTISYRRSIPYHIEPLLIFDAGGKQAAHYRLMAKNRGGVVRLPSVPKSYKNLVIRFWDRASGHAEYRRKKSIEEFAEVAAQAECEKPSGEDVLIVHRRGNKAPATTLRSRIAAKVQAMGGNVNRLHFLPYGEHYATNKYRDVKHVILVGVHQAPPSSIKALVYGAMGKSMSARVGNDDVELMRMSRIMGDTIQAVGRGAIRQMIDGDVPPGCTLDLIASSWGPLGFRDPFGTLAEMFPGATIKPWHPTAEAKEGNSDLVFVEAARVMLGGRDAVVVSVREWASAAGYSERTLQRALKSGKLAALLPDYGIAAELRGGRWVLAQLPVQLAA